MDQGEERTVKFIRRLRLDDLPQSYVSLLKLCLLDTLGATIAGSLSPIEGVITKYLDQVGGNPVSSIVMGRGRASSIAYAAWANAGMANALDICDSSKYSRGHPGAMIVPTALAVGEASRCSGREFMEALAVGYEVAMYAGDCWFHHQQPMQACGSWGSLACAATAARLLKLDHSSTRNALGLAEFYAPGSPMLRSVREPSMAKSAISAGAMTGVQVAQQAAAGHTSITSLLADPKYENWMRQIGRVFLLPSGIEWKPWSACAWGQPAMGAAYFLVIEHRIRLDQIEAIHIRTFDKANALYQGPVSTPEEAQYNIKWPLAALLVHGQVGPNQTLPHQFSDPRILELYDRIFIHRDQEAQDAFRRFDTDSDGTDGVLGGGSAEIRLKNGQAYTQPIANSSGMRWDRGVVEGKFRWLSGYRLDASQIGSLIHLVGAIETLDTLEPLLDHLRFPAAKPSNRLTPPPSSASMEYSPPLPEWFLQLMRLNGYL